MRGTVSLCAVIWWNEETKIKEGKHPSIPQGVEDLVYARNRQLAEAADLVEFLVVDGDSNASKLYGMITSGLEYREVECWIRAAARYWSKVDSTSLGMMGLMRCGRDVTGALPSRTGITKGINEQGPKADLDFEKRPEIRREHPTVLRWPQGSSPCREGRKPPLADVTVNVSRRAGTKRTVLDSNAQAGQARAGLELRGVKPSPLTQETPQSVRREGSVLDGRAVKRPAGRHQWSVGDAEDAPRLEVSHLQRGKEPVAGRRRSAPQPRVVRAGASCQPSSV